MASKLESLGIKRLEGIHYYVRDLERSRQFYCGKLDFTETWRSSPELESTGKQKSACFSAGNINVVCSSPTGEGGRARLCVGQLERNVGEVGPAQRRPRIPPSTARYAARARFEVCAGRGARSRRGGTPRARSSGCQPRW